MLIVVAFVITGMVFSPTPATAAPLRPFSSTSFWYQKIPANAALNPLSDTYKSTMQRLIADHYGTANMNTTEYSSPVFVADADTTPLRVGDRCGYGGGSTSSWNPFAIQLTNVPFPANAKPSAGTDAEITIYQPSTDTIWELWQAEKAADGSWSACWGGRLEHASQSEGIYDKGFGVAATGLSLMGGMIHPEEIAAGRIDHVIDISLPHTQLGVQSWPANRNDGDVEGIEQIPEGIRIRIDPSVNFDTFPGLTPVARIVGKAMQEYGAVVRDKAGAVSFYGINTTPVIEATGVNPWTEAFGGKAGYEQFTNFPWQSLQFMPFDYGKPGTTVSTTVPTTPTVPTTTAPPRTAIPSAAGYRVVSATGRVRSFGSAQDFGSARTTGVETLERTPDNNGYWITNATGDVYPFGSARSLGSMGGKRLNKPIVGMASTATGSGYWLVASDGGIFAFGDATFHGAATQFGDSVRDIES